LTLIPTPSSKRGLDSKLIVEQMSGRWKIKLPPGQVAYVWVPREQNRHADSLVNRALDGEGQPSLPAEVAAPQRALPGWGPDMGPPTVTLLGRHGATALTLERRFSGAGGEDPPLAPVGREQAEALGAEIARRGGVDRVVCSPLLRARETADIVAAATGVASPEPVEDLAECSFGDWDGLTFAEVRERWPGEMAAWLGSTAVAPPGGESFESHRERVDRARLHLLQAHHGERVAVIAHVTPIKMLVGIALDVPVHTLYRMELLPCSLTTIGWWRDGNASLRGFAESGHLDGLVTRSP